MNNPKAIRLAAKALPIPSSISAEAQSVLRSLVNDDGIPLNSLHVMPALDDHRAWLAVKAMAERHYASVAETVKSALRSKAETILIEQTTVHVANPTNSVNTDYALIDLHGGAFVFGGGEACSVSARMQADQHGIVCYGVDYRMPPEHPFPAALNDCLAVYRYLINTYDPTRIGIIGRSAGGNLAAAMLLQAGRERLPMPGAIVLLSPAVDLTESGDSFRINEMIDAVLPKSLMPMNMLYAAGADLNDPYLSPLFGDLTGFPPTFLQSGTRDLLLSNTVRMHRALRSAGVSADLHVFEAMPHGGFMRQTPEDRQLLQEIGAFLRKHLAITMAS